MSQMTVTTLPMSKVKLGRNSRLDTSKGEIEGLMASIKEQGLLQPVGVSKKGKVYELCYGNRRFVACEKLGWKDIPAVIHESKKQHEDDIRNLTENMQRKNISLQEAGRYMHLLKKTLSREQIAIRLGFPLSYVKTCMDAYSSIPKVYQKDIEVRAKHDRKRTLGKISIASATSILSAKKTFALTDKEVNTLFRAAKTDERFMKENVYDYVTSLRDGSADPIGETSKLTHVSLRFFIDKEYQKKLIKKHVSKKGPYKTFSALMLAIVRGQKSLKLDVRA